MQTCADDLPGLALDALLARYGLRVVRVGEGAAIPGSYWGEPEAGLIGDALYVRSDTPLHSALHEACHYICMDERRRSALHTDAGGAFQEETATCYLQLVLADHLPGLGRNRLCADMDAWGYSFRLGSARAWLEGDAEDAHAWLVEHGLVDSNGAPTFRLRACEEIPAATRKRIPGAVSWDRMPPGRRHSSLQERIHGVSRETAPEIRHARDQRLISSQPLRACESFATDPTEKKR